MGLDHEPACAPGSLVCKCGKPALWHKGKRIRTNTAYHREYAKARIPSYARDRIIGIDGEGITLKDGGKKRHIYNYLAAADEGGNVWELGEDPKEQIETAHFLDFILELPENALIFAFAFLYDLTKGLQGLGDVSLYLLFHEQKRQRIVDRGKKTEHVVYTPVDWPDTASFKRGFGYRLNYMNRKFSVCKGKRARTVWDVFAFFQSKFTKALVDWSVGERAEIERMERMKEKRSRFDAQAFWEIKQYCQTECKHLATLGRELLDAHEGADIHLTQFYGAGSTAKALMKRYDVRRFIDNKVPEAMREAIACAFFGGRFENSVIGAIREPVQNADINSAYPYAATFLPCLIHGRWRKCKRPKERDLQSARLALIRWHLPRKTESEPGSNGWSSWGPLPVRKLNGTIAFPLGASGGWTWKEEFLAARNLRPDVVALDAWLYLSECKCQPFSFLPEVYLERLRLGSDSRGIPLKLGPNSVYGALVQSVGFRPPFQCWIWGGNITSTCRAQLLEAMACLPSLDDVLMLATDGLWFRKDERFNPATELPKPRDTGTSGATALNPDKGPLGAWSCKTYEKGVFAARPGIYFPLDPSEDELSKVRARGLGRRSLYENHRLVTEAFSRGQDSVTIGARHCDVNTREERGHQRFIGAKTGMKWSRSGGVKRDDDYGEWIDWPIDVTFDPHPKRDRILEGGKLKCWDWFEAESVPYDPALETEEDKLLELAHLVAEEQPNAEWMEE